MVPAHACRHRLARRPLAALALALAVLPGCAELAPPGGTPAPSVPAGCCASLAELPYRPVDPGRSMRIDIDDAAPTVAFETGRSRVAAIRLPDAPRPLVIDVASRQIAGPGIWGQVFLHALKRKVVVFHPTVHLLDAGFRIVQTLRPEPIGATPCASFSDEAARLWLHFNVEAPPAQAAYLVIATTEADLAVQSDTVCGETGVRYSPVGRLDLRVDGPDFADGRIVLDAPARWHEGARQLGFWADLGAGLVDEAPGRLMLGEQRLHYLEREDTGLTPRLDLPASRLAAVESRGRDLVVAAAGPAGGPAAWHTFRLAPRAGVSADAFAEALRAQMRPDAVVETVGVAVPAWSATLEVRPAGQDASRGHIGDAAATGGVVAALPCGLCQVGGCTPEILASCAAAFTVGATLGGVWAAGRELVGSIAQRPAAGAAAARAAATAAGVGGPAALGAAALRACLAAELAQPSATTWRDRGWTAHLQAVPDAGPARAAPVVETTVTGLTLEVQPFDGGTRPADEAPARLVVAGVVRYVAAGGAARSQALAWTSDWLTLAQWAGAPAQDLQATWALACRGLAGQALGAGEALWRAH